MDTQTVVIEALKTQEAVFHAAAWIVPSAIFLAVAVYQLIGYRKP